ncbi:MAG: diadenylate cyclase CdaA [Clostridiaceae bacterium]|nr:diadenylate cyclase CdaA [Clostridiaceae bacterium]
MQLSSSDILTDLGKFITDLFQNMASGLLFFGGPLDITVAVLDILATTLVVYYVLKILRDSRAWQLLKGLILILAFAVVCSLIGLTTVGFLLNNTISVLAIAFVVIFQPELRRALETVGRSSFNVISSAITPEEKGRSSGSVHNLIEAIVRACEKMAETRTGALIILERQTKLGELVEQENVVQLDAAVSATMLMQIFYKGSPLHDGAVLIRDGRLTAARVHVPLSDNYHLRRDYGTRHRAAIGASEMGDAIAVVVSEERGSIGLTLEGRLYQLDNGDALRTLLHKLLTPGRGSVSLSNLSSLFHNPRRQNQQIDLPAADADSAADDLLVAAPASKTGRKAKRRTQNVPVRKKRALLTIASLAIAIVLWLYVQVTINPIDTKSYTVPLTYRNVEAAQDKGYDIQFPLQNVQVTIMGRKKTLSGLKSESVTAYLDFSQIDSTGLIRMNVQIDTKGLLYLRASYISPNTITVSIRDKAGE